MSSRSTRKTAASVIDLPDQQTVSDPVASATDMPAEQEPTCDVYPAIVAESPASDQPAAETIDTAPEIEAEPGTEIAPEERPQLEPNVAGDMLGQQLEQLVQSVSVVE